MWSPRFRYQAGSTTHWHPTGFLLRLTLGPRAPTVISLLGKDGVSHWESDGISLLALVVALTFLSSSNLSTNRSRSASENLGFHSEIAPESQLAENMVKMRISGFCVPPGEPL